MLKIKVLLRSYFQLLFQDFLYLTMLFTMIVFGLTAEHLLGIGVVKKYSLLLIGAFFLALFSTMNLYHNDRDHNLYLKQKVNSYWADVISQFLVAVIINLFSGIMIFAFGRLFKTDFLFDTVGIITLVSVGLLGSAIATLFKTQWYRHSSLGQVGILVFIYLALSGSVIQILSYAEWIFPPLSKLLMSLRRGSTIISLLPIAGQTILYSIILFIISSFIYKKNNKN